MSTNLSSFTKNLSKVQTNYNIVEFAEKKSCLGIKLFPQQRFLLKLFDKVPLEEKIKDIEVRDKFGENIIEVFSEVGFYDYLYKEGRISLDYNTYMSTDIVSILVAAGRGATKTTTLSLYTAYKLYEILNHYCPQEYFGILSHDSINISIVSISENTAIDLFSRLNNLILNASFFKPYLLTEPLQGELRIWTQADLDKIKGFITNPPAHSNSISVTAKPSSAGLRGANRAISILEEFAFFNNSPNSVRTLPLDEQIYRAVTPSVARFKYPNNTPFGKVLMISSPGGENGKFFEEYKMAFELGAKSSTIAISAPTWTLNPTISKSFFMSEFNKNPQSFASEYGAEFQTYENRWLVDDRPIFRAVDTSLDPKKQFGDFRTQYFLGADPGFSDEGFSIAISHYESEYIEIPENFLKEVYAYFPEYVEEIEQNEGKIISPKYILDYFEVFYPGVYPYENYGVLPVEGENGMIERIVTCAKRFPIRKGFIDHYSGAVLQELLLKRGLKNIEMVNVNATINNDVHKIFNMLLHQYMIKMGHDPLFIKELKALKASIVGNGFLKVTHPTGGNDDLYSAVARSIYLCWLYTTKNKNALSNMGITYKDNKNYGGFDATAAMRGQKVFESMKTNMHSNQHSLRNPRNMFPNKITR